MAYKRNVEIFEEAYEKKDAKSVVSYVARDGRRRYIAGNKNPDGGGNMPSGGGMEEVTWQELKDKRDNGELNPGSLYRITDYNCTTTQENTQSAGHQFDIVLLALSEDKLAEEGWAMMHDNIYDVTFSDGVTKKCYIYVFDDGGDIYLVDVDTLLGFEGNIDVFEIDEDNKTAQTSQLGSDVLTDENLPYNYFQNSNLSAWKVWYCLDNDKSRFAWADDSVDTSIVIDDSYVRFEEKDRDRRFCWHSDTLKRMTWTDSETPAIGDNRYLWNNRNNTWKSDGTVQNVETEGTGLPNARGVIYRLIDEFNNDIKYDFKNIQFKRKITNGQYDANGTETWCYTLNAWYNDMCQDASILGNTLPNDEGFVTGVYDNIFGYATAYDLYIEGVNTFAFALGNNVVLSFDDGGYSGIHSNTIGNNFNGNTIGNNFYDNTIGNNSVGNTIGNSFNNNTIGNYFNSNTIGNNFNGNTIGNFCGLITISDNTSYANYGNNGVELATKS